MHTPEKMEYIKETATLEKALHLYVMGIHQPTLVKNVSIYLCHRHTGRKLKQIGRHFNIGESAVSQASRRIGMKINRDKKLKKLVKGVEKKLSLSIV